MFQQPIRKSRITWWLALSNWLLEDYLGLDDLIPVGGVGLGDVRARLLHWDPKVMSALRERGAECEDFLAYLDGFIIPSLAGQTDVQAHESYDKCRRFYLNHSNDFVREAAFRDRLGLDRAEPPDPGSD